MRKSWLGFVALLFTAACTHDGLLRPQAGAVPLTEDGNAGVTGAQGVTLVAYGSNWKGAPRDIERHFTPVEIRLENHSGRPLSVRYVGFALEGRKTYVARSPNELGRLLASRDHTVRPATDVYRTRTPTRALQAKDSAGQPTADTTYSSHNGTAPYTPPPCYTCTSTFESASLPSPDMLRQAFSEGLLEDGQSRQGYLYFEEPLLLDNHANLKVKLVDASTNEPFGELIVPFEVH
jgi:hypothetical protein